MQPEGAEPGSSTTLPAAADAALRPLFLGLPAEGRVVVATPAAVYAEVASPAVLVAVLTPDAVRVPGSLVPAVDAAGVLARLRLGSRVVAGGGSLVLDGVRLVPSRWWDSAVPRVTRAAGTAPEPVPMLPPLPEDLRAGAVALSAALARAACRLPAAAAGLVGLGPGLTPAGDDVLAGALVALAASGDEPRRALLAAAVRPLLGRTTTVSAAFLGHAMCGRAVPQLARYVSALAGGRAVGGVVQDLLKVGASSGLALAHGAWIGLRAAGAPVTGADMEVA